MKPAPNRIRELRKAKGLTQIEFADLIGISQGWLCKLEQGQLPDLETGYEIMQAFGGLGVTEIWPGVGK